jgi:hypothetical protein
LLVSSKFISRSPAAEDEDGEEEEAAAEDEDGDEEKEQAPEDLVVSDED